MALQSTPTTSAPQTGDPEGVARQAKIDAITRRRKEDAIKQARINAASNKAEMPSMLDATLETAGRLGDRMADAALEYGTEFLPDIGGMIGGTAGFAVAGAPGAVAGGVAGGVAGDMAKRRIKGQPQSPAGSAREGGVQGGAELIGVGVAKVGGKIANKVFRGGTKYGGPAHGGLLGRTLRGAAEADTFLKTEARRLKDFLISSDGPALSVRDANRIVEGAFLPAQVTHGRLLDELQGFGSGSVTASKIQNIEHAREELFEAISTASRDALAPYLDVDTASRLFVDQAEAVIKDSRAHFGRMHQVVEDTVGNVKIDMSDVQGMFAKEAKHLEEMGSMRFDPEGISRVVEATQKPQGLMSYSTVKNLRTDINGMLSRFEPEDTTRAKGALKRLHRVLTEKQEEILRRYDTAKGLTDTDGSMLKLKRLADEETTSHYKMVQTQRMDDVIDLVRMHDAGAKAMAKLVEKQTPARMAKFADAIGRDTQAWHQVQRYHLNNLWEASRTAPPVGGGVMRRANGQNFVRKLNEFGRETNEAIFGNELTGKLYQLGEAMKIGQQRTASKTSIHILETGAIFTVGAGFAGGVGAGVGMRGSENRGTALGIASSAVLAGSSILVSSRLLNRWLTNPKNVDRIIAGVRGDSFKARESAAWIARLIASAGKDEISVLPEKMTPEQYTAAQRRIQ